MHHTNTPDTTKIFLGQIDTHVNRFLGSRGTYVHTFESYVWADRKTNRGIMCFIRGELYSCLGDSLIQPLLTFYKYDRSSVDYLVPHTHIRSQTDTHTLLFESHYSVLCFIWTFRSTFSNPIHVNITPLFLISSDTPPPPPLMPQGSVCLNWPPVEVQWSSSRCFWLPDLKCSPTSSYNFHQKALSPPPLPAPSPLPFLVKMQKARRGGRHLPMQMSEWVSEQGESASLCVCVFLVLMKMMKRHSQQKHTYTHKSVCDWKKETSTFVIEIWFKWWKGDSIFMQYISAVFETKFLFIRIVNARQWSRCFLPHSLAV